MKRLYILLIALFFLSCSSISVERKSELSFKTLFIGKVLKKTPITLAPNESSSERALVGFLAGGVIGAVATADTEKGFNEPKAFKYTLKTKNQETRDITSYSVVNQNDCVEVISPDDTGVEILRILPLANCS
jgi:hypothetical protein